MTATGGAAEASWLLRWLLIVLLAVVEVLVTCLGTGTGACVTISSIANKQDRFIGMEKM